MVDGLLRRLESGPPELRLVFSRDARHREHQPGLRSNESKLFGLPLVDRDRGLAEIIEQSPGIGRAAHELAKFRTAKTFATGRDQQNRSAGLDDVRGGGDPLDGLVEGQVQRIAA